MGKFLIDLSDKAAVEPEISGGKGANLALLFQKGLNVPPSVIISSKFIDKLLGEEVRFYLSENLNGDGRDRLLANVKEKINSADISELLGEEFSILRKLIAEWGAYAVRTSFVEEDKEEFSLAGMGESVVALTEIGELEKSIKKVLRSFFCPRVLEYILSFKDNPTLGIAVVVQKFIPGDVSGVIFTDVDGKFVIEYLPGTALPLVQGFSQPARYIINRNNEQILEKKVPAKLEGMFFKGSKLIEEVVRGFPLPKRTLHQLLEISKEIEDIYGSPRDIEWTYCCGRIFILQARPITHKSSKTLYHWSKVLGEEFWSGKVSPLMYSIVGSSIENAMIKEPLKALLGKENKLKDVPAIGNFYNHIYINLDLLREAFRVIPRWALTQDLLKMFPPNMQCEIKRNSSILPIDLLLGIVRFLSAGMPWWFHINYRRFNHFVEERIKKLPPVPEIKDYQSGLKFLKGLKADLEEFLSVVVWGVTYAYISVPLTNKIFARMVGEEPAKEFAHLLFSDLKGDENIRFLKAINYIKNRMPEEWKHITNEEDLQKAKEKYPDFAREWNDFIQKYGHRAEERDIIAPRWEEREILVIKIVASSGKGNFEELSTSEAWVRVKKKLKERRIKINYLYFLPFYTFLWLSRTYLTMRENMRFYADIYLLRMRKVLLQIGKMLKERGILSEPEHIFFFHFDELEKIFSLKEDEIEEILQERIETFRKLADPPDYIVGGRAFEIPQGEYEHLRGETISPGFTRGKVRIVKNPEDFFKVQSGEIVVMSNLDPSWSALVGKVSGAIFEVGGLLSHGAIVAREFRIPAVAGIRDATKILKEGEEVILDATAGTVSRHLK